MDSADSRPDAEAASCRTCLHWRALFTGEAWGVRSFADAPEEARLAVENRLRAQENRDGYRDTEAALGDMPEMSVDDQSHSVPGSTDWPYWGECALTEYGSDMARRSLARAIDGSQYMAVLRCRCDFGCVQWRPFAPPAAASGVE